MAIEGRNTVGAELDHFCGALRLVEAHNAGVRAERERCAQVRRDYAQRLRESEFNRDAGVAEECAETITRGEG